MKPEAAAKQRSQNKGKHVMPDKALRVLANSIYQTLRDEGCQHKDILGVSSQLIGLVTSDLLHNELPSEASVTAPSKPARSGGKVTKGRL